MQYHKGNLVVLSNLKVRWFYLRSLNSKQREIAGILLFLLAVFSLMSLYFESTGWVGLKIKKWLEVAFGETAAVFSVILIVIAISFFRGKFWPIKIRKLIGYFLLLSCFMTIYHLLSIYQGYQLPPSMEEEIYFGQMGLGAGVVGAILMVVFLTAFGRIGSYIIIGGLSLIGIILVFNISFISLYKKAASFFVSMMQDISSGIKDIISEIGSKIGEFKENHQALVKLETSAAAENDYTKGQTHEINADKHKGKHEKRTERISTAQKPAQPETSVEKTSSSGYEHRSSTYRMPSVNLLKKSSQNIKHSLSENKSKLLEKTFDSFGIIAKVVNVCQGPVVTRYELQIGPGIKVSRITSLADDLALALAATNVRIEAPVPGKSVVGIEVPNKTTQPVLIRDVIEHPGFMNHPSKVAMALGKDIAGEPVIGDLKKWLHLLVAGATGSGKSVCLNAIIISLLFRATPEEVKLLMIDPKRVELANYDGIPHLISPVITDLKKAATALKWAVGEMERRYKLFADVRVKNIESYYQYCDLQNEKLSKEDIAQEEEEIEHLPYIVIIVDELADLMMVAASEVEDAICRLAQMARATGMYLILSTQRPSVDVITGLIKANVPSRISFAVSSQIDSRTILDMGGAERLIGKGDMLYYPMGASKPNRAQGAYVSDKEVQALVRFWKKQAEPEYEAEVLKESSTVSVVSDDTDELLEDAIRLVVETGQASISMLQRRFRIGYNRAARLIDTMEVRSIVGPYQGSKPREVLIDSDSLDF